MACHESAQPVTFRIGGSLRTLKPQSRQVSTLRLMMTGLQSGSPSRVRTVQPDHARLAKTKWGGDVCHLPFLSLTNRNNAASPWFYAALPGAFISRVFSLPTFTLICLGLASAFLARLIFSMPLS